MKQVDDLTIAFACDDYVHGTFLVFDGAVTKKYRKAFI